MLTRLFISLLHTTWAVLSVHALDVSNGRHSYVSNKRQEAPCTTDSCVCFAGGSSQFLFFEIKVMNFGYPYFLIAEITCLNTGSDAPIASDCSNLAIQILSAPYESQLFPITLNVELWWHPQRRFYLHSRTWSIKNVFFYRGDVYV